MFKNKFLSFTKSGKYEDDGEGREHLISANGVPPKFGFNWWYWKPVYESNSKSNDAFVSRNLSWLCFIVDYTDFSKK